MPEASATAQFRNDEVDKVLQSARRDGRHDVETVCAVVVEALFHDVGDVFWRAGSRKSLSADLLPSSAGDIGAQNPLLSTDRAQASVRFLAIAVRPPLDNVRSWSVLLIIGH